MSIAAEAIIRWAENTNFIAALAKPRAVSPLGDNQDFRLNRALKITALIIIPMFFWADYLHSIGFDENVLRFTGLGDARSEEAMKAMYSNWIVTASQSYVYISVILGTFFRAIIYKRSA